MGTGILRFGKIFVWIIYVFVLIDIVLLLMAFFLQLFGANPSADFAQWVYRSAARPMEPFRGLFPTHVLTSASVLNTSLLFAIIIYLMIALALHALIDWLVARIAANERAERGATQTPAPRPM